MPIYEFERLDGGFAEVLMRHDEVVPIGELQVIEGTTYRRIASRPADTGKRIDHSKPHLVSNALPLRGQLAHVRSPEGRPLTDYVDHFDEKGRAVFMSKESVDNFVRASGGRYARFTDSTVTTTDERIAEEKAEAEEQHERDTELAMHRVAGMPAGTPITPPLYEGAEWSNPGQP